MTVRARRAVLAKKASGRVLDLGGSESHQHLWTSDATSAVMTPPRSGSDTPEAVLDRLIDRDEVFDTIFSVFHLIAAPSLERTLDQLRQLLADDGQLLFLEPGLATGVTGRLQRLSAPVVNVTSGWQIQRDVASSLRGAGLTITDIERHRSRTMQPWMRQLVEGVAQHALLGHDGG